MWTIIKDIAIYHSGANYNATKIVLTDDDEITLVELNTIGDVPKSAMDELRKILKDSDTKCFQRYVRCEVCDELFQKTSKNRTICSGKCRTRKSRSPSP